MNNIILKIQDSADPDAAVSLNTANILARSVYDKDVRIVLLSSNVIAVECDVDSLGSIMFKTGSVIGPSSFKVGVVSKKSRYVKTGFVDWITDKYSATVFTNGVYNFVHKNTNLLESTVFMYRPHYTLAANTVPRILRGLLGSTSDRYFTAGWTSTKVEATNNGKIVLILPNEDLGLACTVKLMTATNISVTLDGNVSINPLTITFIATLTNITNQYVLTPVMFSELLTFNVTGQLQINTTSAGFTAVTQWTSGQTFSFTMPASGGKPAIVFSLGSASTTWQNYGVSITSAAVQTGGTNICQMPTATTSNTSYPQLLSMSFIGDSRNFMMIGSRQSSCYVLDVLVDDVAYNDIGFIGAYIINGRNKNAFFNYDTSDCVVRGMIRGDGTILPVASNNTAQKLLTFTNDYQGFSCATDTDAEFGSALIDSKAIISVHSKTKTTRFGEVVPFEAVIHAVNSDVDTNLSTRVCYTSSNEHSGLLYLAPDGESTTAKYSSLMLLPVYFPSQKKV